MRLIVIKSTCCWGFVRFTQSLRSEPDHAGHSFLTRENIYSSQKWKKKPSACFCFTSSFWKRLYNHHTLWDRAFASWSIHYTYSSIMQLRSVCYEWSDVSRRSYWHKFLPTCASHLRGFLVFGTFWRRNKQCQNLQHNKWFLNLTYICWQIVGKQPFYGRWTLQD